MKENFSPVVSNKKAGFEYLFIQNFEAGIMLTGTEVKAVRNGEVNLSDAYCYFKNEELWIKGMHIAEYKQGGYSNHITKRERKLLLRKAEIRKLQSKIKEKGTTIVPVKLYFSNTGYAKLEIALARGKKLFDKRETIKNKDVKRELDRAMKR